jgi:hypothetical protein
MIQENLGTQYEITSIFKPHAALANVAENFRNLGNYLTKRDHIITRGGPENSLYINYHHSIEKDINFIAENSINRNVRFVHLF